MIASTSTDRSYSASSHGSSSSCSSQSSESSTTSTDNSVLSVNSNSSIDVENVVRENDNGIPTVNGTDSLQALNDTSERPTVIQSPELSLKHESDDSDEVLIVNELKPRHLRTPVIVDIEESDNEPSNDIKQEKSWSTDSEEFKLENKPQSDEHHSSGSNCCIEVKKAPAKHWKKRKQHSYQKDIKEKRSNSKSKSKRHKKTKPKKKSRTNNLIDLSDSEEEETTKVRPGTSKRSVPKRKLRSTGQKVSKHKPKQDKHATSTPYSEDAPRRARRATMNSSYTEEDVLKYVDSEYSTSHDDVSSDASSDADYKPNESGRKKGRSSYKGCVVKKNGIKIVISAQKSGKSRQPNIYYESDLSSDCSPPVKKRKKARPTKKSYKKHNTGHKNRLHMLSSSDSDD